MSNEFCRPEPRFLLFGDGAEERRIAYRTVEGRAPTLLWLGGYRSDMLGTKAERLDGLARRKGLGFCRFDYSGHGESSGAFEAGTISRWVAEARAIFDAVVERDAILIGSSMGAWIALRLIDALRRERGRRRVVGLLLLAPAPDFTGRLVEPALSPAQRRALETDGFIAEPSQYSSEPDIYTRALIEDGRANSVMSGLIETGCPVHIIQGMADPDVPFSHALELVSHLPSDGVVLTLVRDGDHRLSRESDLLRMEQAVETLVAGAADA